MELNWEKSPMADGYKVLVFNGKAYEEYDVGAETKWTTQNKGIWPTKEEIAEGKFALHHDGKGDELAKILLQFIPILAVIIKNEQTTGSELLRTKSGK